MVEAVEPANSQDLTAAEPIVGTAVSSELQAMPLPTATTQVEINGLQTITIEQNGQILTLQPGDFFVLMLGNGYNWDVSVLDPTIVGQATRPASEESQGIYEALQTGKTELTASGDPLCRSQKPACMMPSISFAIEIVVE